MTAEPGPFEEAVEEQRVAGCLFGWLVLFALVSAFGLGFLIGRFTA